MATVPSKRFAKALFRFMTFSIISLGYKLHRTDLKMMFLNKFGAILGPLAT